MERLGFAPGRLDAAALLRAAAAAGVAPRVFALGASTARLALESAPQRGEVYLAFPTMPLRASSGPAQELLAGALEGLYRFEAGVTAPVSYGPARRVGASGACIVKLDAAARTFVPIRDWVSAEDR